MSWQRIKIEIPKEIGPAGREDLAFQILEFIRERTKSGVGLNAAGTRNKVFPGYSDSYVKSLDFKIAGKSKGNVNLKLSGDMMDAMDLLRHKAGELTIGFENGTIDNDKAEGNIYGSYGGAPNPAKARNFLGITDKDLRTVIDGFQND